jgi:hypothetical protein
MVTYDLGGGQPQSSDHGLTIFSSKIVKLRCLATVSQPPRSIRLSLGGSMGITKINT